MIGRYTGLLLLVLVVSTFPTDAQPAMSRGEQEVAVPHDECMRRAEVGLIEEGYVNIWRTGSSVAGYKDIHSSIIMCNGSPSGMTWANVVTASLSNDGGVPGSERQRLQERMNQAATGGGGGTYSVTVNPSFATSGTSLTVSFTAPTGRPARDWVGLYQASAPNTTHYGQWQYTEGRVSGSLVFYAPSPAGAYEFRYFLNDGYEDMTARVGFTVGN